MSEPDDVTADDGSDAVLAIDFALGALDGPTLRSAELRLRRDPDFARDVARWAEQLGPLADAVGPVAAPAVVWSRIEGELFRAPVARAAAATSPAGFWSRVAVWRGLAVGTSAVAAVALGLVAARPADAPVAVPPPAARSGALLAASMASTDAAKAVLITATYDPDRGAVILTPAAKDASRGLTPELWLIVGKDAPRSLGLIDLKGAQAHVIPKALRGAVTKGATLAISLEPAGGSPTGAPTGPVVAAGTLSAI